MDLIDEDMNKLFFLGVTRSVAGKYANIGMLGNIHNENGWSTTS